MSADKTRVVVLAERMTAYVIFDLLKVWASNGYISRVIYISCNPIAAKLISALRFLRICGDVAGASDYSLIDKPYCRTKQSRARTFLEMQRIEGYVKVALAEKDENDNIRFIHSISKQLAQSLWINRVLANYGLHRNGMDDEAGEKIIVLVKNKVFYEPPFQKDIVTSSRNKNVYFVPELAELSGYKHLLYRGVYAISLLLYLMIGHKREPDYIKDRSRIGVTGVWGLDEQRKNDLFWSSEDAVGVERICYLLERDDFLASHEIKSHLEDKSLECKALLKKYHSPERGCDYLSNIPVSRKEVFGKILKIIKLFSVAAFSSQLSRIILTEYMYLVVRSFFYQLQLNSLGIKGLFHYQEAGHDYISLACENMDAVRFGTHWSFPNGPMPSSIVDHQVYFYSGEHTARIGIDSGAGSKHIILSGFMFNDFSNPADRLQVRSVADRLRENGCKYVLLLLDSSVSTPSFYDFFLKWLLEDDQLGILTKSKLGVHSYPELFSRAKETQRLVELDSSLNPADASVGADFSIGIGSPSAVMTVGLSGGKGIFLDYEGNSDPLNEQYAILHALGENRCVYYDEGSLKKGLTEYFNDNDSHPGLGDMTPVLNKLDAFRDGMAGRRIGEYVGWYLAGVDNGEDRDSALLTATKKYADKWGEDKVLRGLE